MSTTSKILSIKEHGVVINWKYLILGILIVFGGGGSWLGISLATVNQVDDKIEIQSVKQKAVDVKQDNKIKENIKEIHEVKEISGQVKFKLDAVQEVQHRQIARDESRRVTEKIRNRNTRENEYDRIYNLNMKRLETGKDPCTNINCN